MKKVIGVGLTLLVLSGCTQPTYQKVQGKVIELDAFDRQATVSYSLDGKKYQIGTVTFDSGSSLYHQLYLNEKVEVYANQNGVEEIAK